MQQPLKTPDLAAGFTAVRAASAAPFTHLGAEDMAAQSMPDASPAKWHLAHTTWFFETFLLQPFEPVFTPHNPAFRQLFNSYYNGIGAPFPRGQRGLLTRPSLGEILAYRSDVDARMQHLLDRGALPTSLVELGLQHEQQHQELMRTDLLHLFAQNPLYPACFNMAPPATAPGPEGWVDFPAALTQIGHDGPGFGFDNETPRHRLFLEGFSIANRLVTQGEYAEFVADSGYLNPALWLSEGFDFIRREQITAPLYWRRCDDSWQQFTLHGMRPLQQSAPVTQLSYYEADAYARWAGARLPSEAEWEHAAGSGRIAQSFGLAWQWTSSAYAAYPGFRAAADTIGEYNGKFMVNQYVLRGSSSATPTGHARLTYRNFFPAHARWQFSGLRLCR